jgi:hypothetical protein
MVSLDNNNPSTSAPLLITCHYSNKWEKWYWNLIETRLLLLRPIPKKRGSKTGLEKHHIIPTCCGGRDEIDNYVMLTKREHFIAHLLLSLAYDWNTDLWWSIFKSSKQWELNSRQVEKIIPRLTTTEEARRKNSEWHLDYYKDKANHPWTGRTMTEEHKQSISKTVKPKVTGINNPRARQELWSRFDELFELWVELGKPAIRKFGKHLGLPDSYVTGLVRNFRKKI